MPQLPARAADVDATSAVDAVTVYPDGASVTRVITLDLPAGDHSAVLKDFPLTLDPSSLRVEGEAGAKLTIGAIDAKPPRAAPPVNLPEIDKRIEALKDQRADLQGAIDAAAARRKFAERFAEASPAGIGDKGEARPLTEWRAAFAAVAEEVATADTAIRDAERKQREIDREIARLEADRAQKPPSKLEVRIELAAAAATKATLRVTYAVRNARWTPLYDARLDTGAKDRKPALELVRRAEITQNTGEDWSNVALAVSTVRTARGGKRAGSEFADRAISATAAAARPHRSARRHASAAARDAASCAQPAPGAAEAYAKAPKSSRPRPKSAASRSRSKFPAASASAPAKAPRACASATATIAPDLAVRSVPVIDPTAFLEASFKQTEDAPLLPGRVSIYRDGVFVGRGQMAAASKDETVRLGFGADDKVKIERTVVKRNEGSAGLIVTTRRPTSARSRPPCATAMISRSGSRSRISCRSARTRTSRSRCCRRRRRRPRPTCATSAACWNGRSRPSPARSGISPSPGACAGPRTRAS